MGTRCVSTQRGSTAWPRGASCVARSSPAAPRTPFGAAGTRRSRGSGGCAPSTCSIETPPPSGYFPPAMIVIPQKVRDGFGNLLDPLALRLIRLHVRPNLITTLGTAVIVGSAVAVALGWARWGGGLLPLFRLFGPGGGRRGRRGGTGATFWGGVGAVRGGGGARGGPRRAAPAALARHASRARAGPANSERTVIVAPQSGRDIAPATGKLGVLLVGLGAVSTTFVAGVENVRRGSGLPIGSISQMGTIRLGKRTEKRSPKIKEFVPLADLKDLVFAAWDPIPDDAYAAAVKAGVLERHEHLEPIKDFLQVIKPLPAAFEQHYVKRLTGTNLKQGQTKRDLAEALRPDTRRFKQRARAARAWACPASRWCRSPLLHSSDRK